jgi:hypothetical protein
MVLRGPVTIVFRKKLLLLVLLIVTPPTATADEIRISDPWPVIAAINHSFDFTEAKEPSVDFYIDGTDGSRLYRLKCGRGGQDEFHGYFACKLWATNERLNPYGTWDTLLLSEPEPGSTSWNDRGSFDEPYILSGKCAAYPGWGLKRDLRLRRMHVTLAIDDVRTGSTAVGNKNYMTLEAFRFTINVQPDPEAISSVAEPVPVLRPSLSNGIEPSCDRALPRHIPGQVDERYIRENKLQSPYVSIVPGSATQVFPLGMYQELDLPLLDSAGHLAYTLKCLGDLGQGAGLAHWGINCGLFRRDEKLDLLKDSTDPYSRRYRGLIESEQLTPQCGNYSEWGSTRHFELRGMLITLSIGGQLTADDPQGNWSDKTVSMSASVAPRSSATSPVALPSGYIDWRLMNQFDSCKQILISQPAENSRD